MSYIINFLYELPQEFPKDLRYRILRKEEILRKSQSWLEEEFSTQYPIQK